jgi:carboxynorspermidine decarboxylase
VLGEWSFPSPLHPGDRVVFADMSHYTMVKTTMFNGVKHPSLATWDGHELKVVRRFDYADFRNRLG